jgi:CRISPR system Cascade subunit CasD
MSKFVALRLVGPMQSWGIDSRSNTRHTADFPSFSGVVGMIGAGLGGLTDAMLPKFKAIWVTSLSKDGKPPRILVDYQNVGAAHTSASRCTSSEAGYGKGGNIQTWRHYLIEACFHIVIEIDDSLDLSGLRRPVFPMYLGRKCCVPSEPILVGIYDSLDHANTALDHLRGEMMVVKQQRPAMPNEFSDGRITVTSVNDVFVSVENRKVYSPRKVVVSRA